MSTETTELTDEAINIFLARKCGWEYWNDGTAEEPSAYIVIPDENPSATAPRAYERPFTDSLDALFAHGGPVEKCREAEYAVSLYLGSFTRPPWTYEALIEIDMPSRGDDGTFEMAVSSNPARAMAEACALALGIMGCAQDIT